MGRAHDTFDELDTLFAQNGVDDVLVASSGDVYIGSQGVRRPHSQNLTPKTVAAIADALAQSWDGDGDPGGSFEVESERALWTVVRPPLSPAVSLVGRKRPRQHQDLAEFVDQGLMTSDIADGLVSAVRAGRNVLIASGERRSALAVFDALLSLPSPGQLSVFIGDTRTVDLNHAQLTYIDRRGLDRLTDDAAAPLLQLVSEARWSFCDKLGCADDLRWWFGGDAYSHGRVGVLRAADLDKALTRLQALHRDLHSHDRHVNGLVDAVLFVDHLRPNRDNAMRWRELGPAHHSGLRPMPVAAPADTPTSVHPARPSAVATDPQELRRELSGVRPRPNLDASSSSGLRRMPQAGDPLADVEPDFTLGENVADPTMDPDVLDSSLSRAVAGAFDEFPSEIFDLDSEETQDPRTDDAPVAPDEASFGMMSEGNSGLFGPGELDDVLGDDDPPAQTNSRHPPRRPSGTSRYNAETTRNDAEAIRARQRRRPPSRTNNPVVPRSNSSAELTQPRAIAEELLEPPSSWDKSGQRGAARRGRRRSREPEEQVLSTSDIEILAEDEVLAERTFARHDPPTTDLAAASHPRAQRSFDSANFMKEGTTDEEGPFAGEPTRRAEWRKDKG